MNTNRVAGHGYLMEPPARNTAWREDPEHFEINWTDNQLNCGGFSVSNLASFKIMRPAVQNRQN